MTTIIDLKHSLSKLTDKDLQTLIHVKHHIELAANQILQERYTEHIDSKITDKTHQDMIIDLSNQIHELREEITQLYIAQQKTDDWANHTDTKIDKLENPEINLLGTHCRHVHSLKHPNPEYKDITSTPHVGE